MFREKAIKRNAETGAAVWASAQFIGCMEITSIDAGIRARLISILN